MNQPIPFPSFDPKSARQIGGYTVWIVLFLLVLITARTAVYSVATEGRAVIRRFGRVVAVKEPGLHFKLPFGIDTATFVPTERILKQEFGFRTVSTGRRTEYAKTRDMTNESLMLTGDLNVIDVEWVVQYWVIDPVNYLFNVREPDGTLRDISEAVMRRIIGNTLGSEALTIGRIEIAAQSREELQEILQGYDMGVHIERVELQDVTPPDRVKPAFNEVNEARQQRERLINEAETARNRIIPRARGEADEIIAEAEAYRSRRVNQARGEAARFSELLAAYSEAPALTRQRIYLETLDEVLPQAGKLVVLDGGAGSPLPLLHLRDGGKGGAQ
jgi:membrane protease subunit HflK